MRSIIPDDPFYDVHKFWGERGRYPAKWIWHPKADGTAAVVMAFRKTLTVDAEKMIRIHVSADERYELFLDGQRVGRGSERGDRFNWYFETYDLTLSPGKHTLVARVWWLNRFGPAPFAQISGRPAFVLAAEGEFREQLGTGISPWDAKILNGYKHVPPAMTWGTGSKVHIIGKEFDWGFERGEGDNWIEIKDGDWAYGASQLIDQPAQPILIPATLPAMIEREIRVGKARHVQAMDAVKTDEQFVYKKDHLANEVAAWDALLSGKSSITIPPKTIRRVIVDLEEYYCAYTDLVTSGGAGSMIRSWWAEALYENRTAESKYGQARVKGNRNEIEGKGFLGIGDTFEPDGGKNRTFSTLWWEAGRYLEIVVKTEDEPLTIEKFALRETHYPYKWQSKFESSDLRLSDVIPVGLRVMEMCSHETFMDCPYYEQLMYVGDTRLEVLVSYSWTADARLPRKAIKIYDESRKAPGFTQSRYPSRIQQTIPPFSIWWVAMLHDYAMWRDDPQFVKDRLPGVRAVLDTMTKYKTRDGLYEGPPGWNFMDWCVKWKWGMAPSADTGGVSAPSNFQLAWVLKQAAELEQHFGEPELAQLFYRRGNELSKVARQAFWSDSRGLYSDDLDHQFFSEHAQCLALLGDSVEEARKQEVFDNLLADKDLGLTTVYFSHYLFETCVKFNRMDRIFDRLQLWFEMKPLGFKTTLEMPEPSRSDCHAWGAHPLFHYLTSILGIRPAEFGFRSVAIRPQLGPLDWAKGALVHPKGQIEVSVTKSGGHVQLPEGVNGMVHWNGTGKEVQGQARF